MKNRPWLILGAALLLIGSTIGWNLYAGRNATNAREREWLGHEASVIDENLRSQLTATSNGLDSIRNDLQFLQKHQDSMALIDRRLQAMIKIMPGVRTLFVFDSDATVIASNRQELIGLNFRQRDYYQAARKSRNPAMVYVSAPYVTALGVFAMTLVKVILDERGEVAGMVGVTIDPEYFKTLLDSVRYTPDVVTYIAHVDGKLFVSSPANVGLDGMDLAKPGTLFLRHRESGQAATLFTGPSDIAGGECIMAQRSIQLAGPGMDKILVIGVSRDVGAVFSSWNREAAIAGGLFTALALASSLGLIFYRRRQRAYERLRVSRAAEEREAAETLRKSEVLTQAQLKAAHLNMRNLAVHLLKTREEERRSIAQEVHDEVGQQLAALKMDLHWLGKHLPDASAVLGPRIDVMVELCEEAIGKVQRIAADLRPRMLDDLGLAPALQQLGTDFARRTGIACSVSTDFPSRLVGGNAATALYRIAQEAIANVRRHSQAHHATVCLSLEEAEMVLQIEDDGIGITPEQAGAPDAYGLIGLRERVEGLGGRLSIQGEPGKGTTLTARIPLPEEGGLA